MRAFGLPLASLAPAASADEAVAVAGTFGYPVAAKIATRAGQHKSDIQGVRLNLTTPSAVRDAFEDLVACAKRLPLGAADPGVLIQPMVAGGIETIVGVLHDPVFGPVVGFGLGGVNVELFGDMRFRVAPLSDRDVERLVAGTRAARVLRGYRGRPPADLDALRDLLARVSRLAEALPGIAELDLNPVVVLPAGQGCRVVDARIRVGQ